MTTPVRKKELVIVLLAVMIVFAAGAGYIFLGKASNTPPDVPTNDCKSQCKAIFSQCQRTDHCMYYAECSKTCSAAFQRCLSDCGS